MTINPSIFKAYDIRGVYGRDFDEAFAYDLGLAYCKLRREEGGKQELKLVVGYDMRLSSPVLKENLIKGLVDGGAEVEDIGLVGTPTFYFAVAHFKYDGGIMVSASHNPQEYNGFKLVRQLASPIGEDSGIQDLKRLIMEEALVPYHKKGLVKKRDNIIKDHVAYDLSLTEFNNLKPMKVVIDTANSMGAPYFDELLKHLPSLQVEKMNWQLDGSFPVHEADPFKPENVKELGEKIVEFKADLGIATDGDADRIFFLDEKGVPVEPGITRAILCKLFLQEKPNSTIAYDVRPGRITPETIKKYGGQALVTRVGHSLIKQAVIDTGAYFAGESSGHFCLNTEKEGCYEIPGIVALKILKELSESGQKFSDYIKPYQKYFHSGEINMKVKDPQATIIKIKQAYQDGQQNNLDGLSVEYPDYWFNLRSSNTEPLLRLNLEAISQEVMEKHRDELLEMIEEE